MEPEKIHPGTIREAKNFLCLHCKAVLSTPQGINGHLHSKHYLLTTEITYKKDWTTTMRTAGKNKPHPVVDRKGLQIEQ